jgi:type IV pilus assembly protein PilW
MQILNSKRRMLGLGLVEVLVGMALGLFLMAGLGQVYLANKQSYNTAEGLSRMQESLRFAAEMIAQDVRMAGFMPCRETDNIANVLNSGTTTWWADFFNRGISGYDGDHTDDDTGADDHGRAGIPIDGTFDDHVAGTDIVTILRGGESSYNIVTHNAPSATFDLDRLHDLVDGDIVMVCDLTHSAVLQLSQAQPTNVNLVHNTGTATPGNCTKSLGHPVVCSPIGNAYTFGPDSHLVRFSPRAYFIGTNNSNGRSLYRATLAVDGSAVASMEVNELVEGIENMQILYGIDTTDSGYADRYVRADEVLDTTATWKEVVSVRIGLLAQTPREIAINNDSDSYTLAGTSVNPDVTDRKQRYQYNTTIKIRNRGAL